MPVAMTVEDLERFFLAEFPRSFYPESGLTVEAVWERGCRVRQAFRQRSVRPGGTISGPTMMALCLPRSARFRWP
jgi:acyl-coenzyme A thioesterase PaaI-like protein